MDNKPRPLGHIETFRVSEFASLKRLGEWTTWKIAVSVQGYLGEGHEGEKGISTKMTSQFSCIRDRIHSRIYPRQVVKCSISSASVLSTLGQICYHRFLLFLVIIRGKIMAVQSLASWDREFSPRKALFSERKQQRCYLNDVEVAVPGAACKLEGNEKPCHIVARNQVYCSKNGAEHQWPEGYGGTRTCLSTFTP